MRALLIVLWLGIAFSCHGQTVIFDRNHFNIVNENGLVRYASEANHNSNLKKINNRLSDINLNLSSLILVQNLVKNSLTEVNAALRNGIAIKQIISISAEIIKENNELIETAKSEPYLLLFAEDAGRRLKIRSVQLAAEVSDFVLKEGDNVLMDYEKRDFLLRKIILELKVIRALSYSMHRSIYWAKVNGILKTVNPYRNFINRDKWIVDGIIRNYKILKR